MSGQSISASVDSVNNSWELGASHGSTSLWLAPYSDSEDIDDGIVISYSGASSNVRAVVAFAEFQTDNDVYLSNGLGGASVSIGASTSFTELLVLSLLGASTVNLNGVRPHSSLGSSYGYVNCGASTPGYGLCLGYFDDTSSLNVNEGCVFTNAASGNSYDSLIAIIGIAGGPSIDPDLIPVTGTGNTTKPPPKNVYIRPNIKFVIRNKDQGPPTSLQISKSIDQITQSAIADYQRPFYGDSGPNTRTKIDKIGANIFDDKSGLALNYDTNDYGTLDTVQIWCDDKLVFNGLYDTLDESESPEYRLSLTCYDWLSRVQMHQLDLEGWLVGGRPGPGGNLIEAGGAQFETVLVQLLAAAGVPSASINLAEYTGNYGPSSAFLMGSVVPFYATQTDFWSIISEITIYNGWTVYCLGDGSSGTGQIVWKYLSPVPSASSSAKHIYRYGHMGGNGVSNVTYTRDPQYTYNRVEVTGVDASGIHDDHGHKCAQVAAIASAESALDINGRHIIPNNLLNTEKDPVSGKKYLGYMPLQIQSNSIDVPEMAMVIAERILAEQNTMYEELNITVWPDFELDIGDTIYYLDDPKIPRANGGWVIRQVKHSLDAQNGYSTSLQCIRNNWGNAKVGVI